MPRRHRAETVACSIAIGIEAPPDGPITVSVVSNVTDVAEPNRPNVPKLGPRLITAYASQAEIIASGEATPANPLRLRLPLPGGRERLRRGCGAMPNTSPRFCLSYRGEPLSDFPTMLPPIATIIENFEIVEDETCASSTSSNSVRPCPPLPEALRNETNRVHGCESQVWIDTSVSEDGGTPHLCCKASATRSSSAASSP